MNTLKKTLAGVAATATVVTAAASAEAASLTYDFRGSRANLGFSETYTEEGVSITARAFYQRYDFSGDPFGNWRTADLARRSGGLGVKNTGLDDSEIDDSIRFDMLAFELPTFASPARIRFSDVDKNDDWTVWGSSIAPTSLSAIPDFDDFSSAFTQLASGDSNGASFALDPSINFLFVTPALDGKGNDDFFVKKLTIETVPEPAAVLGLVAVAAAAGTALKKKQGIA